MSALPVPGRGDPVVAVPAPGEGPGFWAGAPCAVQDDDGSLLLGYRVRHGHDGRDEVVVARFGEDGRMEPLVTLGETRFAAMGVERPALVRTAAGWRLFVCAATPGSAHWWIGALEAPTIEALADAEHRVVFAGDDAVGVKDPIVRLGPGGWEAWICCHPLDVPGEEDRMLSAYATSEDGWDWDLHGTVLRGRPGEWDARGARLTTFLPDGRAAYDGRATAEENWFERTGIARWSDGAWVPEGEPVADVRYLEVLGSRIFYEARLPDESHELRTELIGG